MKESGGNVLIKEDPKGLLLEVGFNGYSYQVKKGQLFRLLNNDPSTEFRVETEAQWKLLLKEWISELDPIEYGFEILHSFETKESLLESIGVSIERFDYSSFSYLETLIIFKLPAESALYIIFEEEREDGNSTNYLTTITSKEQANQWLKQKRESLKAQLDGLPEQI